MLPSFQCNLWIFIKVKHHIVSVYEQIFAKPLKCIELNFGIFYLLNANIRQYNTIYKKLSSLYEWLLPDFSCKSINFYLFRSLQDTLSLELMNIKMKEW